MPFKIGGQRTILREISWFSLKRNRVPIAIVSLGVVVLALSMFFIAIYECDNTLEGMHSAAMQLYYFGRFMALTGAYLGLFLNIFLRPAPRYVEELVSPENYSKEEKDVREDQ